MRGTDEDVDVRPAVEVRTQLGIDRVTLDVQDIGACSLGDRLDRGATEPESDPQGNRRLGIAHASSALWLTSSPGHRLVNPDARGPRASGSPVQDGVELVGDHTPVTALRPFAGGALQSA